MSFQGVKPTDEWVVVENAHEAIISKETWLRVQEFRKERCPAQTPPALTGANHALSGLLVHETCGARMVIDIAKGRKNKCYVYYTCSTRRTKAKEHCEGIRVRADQIEPYVLDAIYSKLLSDERVEALFRDLERIRANLAKDRDVKLGSWKRELSRLDAQEERLVTAVADGKMPPEAAKGRLEKIAKDRIEVQKRIDGLGTLVDVRQLRVTQDIIVGLRASVQAMIRTKDPRQIRTFLSRFIEKIVVGKDHITIHGSLEKARKTDQATNGSYHRLAWLPGQDSNLQPSG
ncbi:MAG: recombinase zinc beta ribbon domain-containing protein [Candidatus Riflebacteria bacterium]|nr:recombinase zinc beta ribbon domain-containing protein [Candidatus Riflebacteria bacterium]